MSQTFPSTNKGSVSQLSKSPSQVITDEDMNESDLERQMSYLKRQQKCLVTENKVIEKAILRLDPTLMQGVPQAIEYALRGQSRMSFGAGSFIKSQSSRIESLMSHSKSRLLASPSKISSRRPESRFSGIFASGPRINILEKSELVSIEMEMLVKNLEKYRDNAAKQHALLKAKLEELSVRDAYIKKASEQFYHTVVENGVDPISQRIPAETWIRFMNECNKIIDTKIGKLRLRTSTLNTQHSKLRGQIKIKSALSESLRPVDFEKLKIENKESMEIIEYKVQQLELLKKLTGDANLNLSVHKKAMIEQDDYLKKVLKTIKDKQQQTKEIDKEREVIEKQVGELDAKLGEVKKIRTTYEVPDVMEYVKVKSQITDLRNSIKILENRAHIQNIALASLNKKLKSVSLDGN